MKDTTETTVGDTPQARVDVESPDVLLNRELSWLGFARRVLALVESPDLPLLERVKFAGIMGMLHDEFFMKRISGMKRRIAHGSTSPRNDGLSVEEEYAASVAEVGEQIEILSQAVELDLRPALTNAGIPIGDYDQLDDTTQSALRTYFREAVLPILTPLAVDAEHPFPFISNQTLNLAAVLPGASPGRQRFVRIKVPGNRPRWVPVPGGAGFVPLEQVIAANLDLMFAGKQPEATYLFRVTRSAEGHPERSAELHVDDALADPGIIVRVVTEELKARKFAESVRLQVDAEMPQAMRAWLTRQLGLEPADTHVVKTFMAVNALLSLDPAGQDALRLPRYEPVPHPRLAGLEPDDPAAIFEEIRQGDILLHHPYDSFDASVRRFIESAARDPAVLAMKLTIYRTSSDSPIVKALVEAARHGKQVAVLVEITARFDEAPNIAWGQLLEQEGVHVAYGVESLKTHVKLALVVREEAGRVRSYVHVGTGNYHPGTARIYEDLGILTCNPLITADAAAVFNALTGATPHVGYKRLLVAPTFMRAGFTELIRREAAHAREGRPSGIYAKMNQLQDPDVIRELYRANQEGVPITLIVRGLCCLKPGVPGLSETIRVASVVGRYLEHSRIYRFENGGDAQFFIGSADWMKRNLNRRVETITPVEDPAVREELDAILRVYEEDNASAWDGRPDGTYVRRRPAEGEERREAQEVFIRRAKDRARS